MARTKKKRTFGKVNKTVCKMANSLYLPNLLVTFDLRSYSTLSRITNRVISNALLAKCISFRIFFLFSLANRIIQK